ncbi:hypothetical protein AOLI_G00254190 [Acnodon oligacanthus]
MLSLIVKDFDSVKIPKGASEGEWNRSICLRALFRLSLRAEIVAEGPQGEANLVVNAKKKLRRHPEEPSSLRASNSTYKPSSSTRISRGEAGNYISERKPLRASLMESGRCCSAPAGYSVLLVFGGERGFLLFVLISSVRSSPPLTQFTPQGAAADTLSFRHVKDGAAPLLLHCNPR